MKPATPTTKRQERVGSWLDSACQRGMAGVWFAVVHLCDTLLRNSGGLPLATCPVRSSVWTEEEEETLECLLELSASRLGSGYVVCKRQARRAHRDDVDLRRVPTRASR